MYVVIALKMGMVNKMEVKFRELRPDEIELRVGTCTSKGFSLLLYKTARTDSNILDEVVGCMNWQSDYKVVNDNLYCGIGIYDEDKKEWVYKWDCGTESYTEKEKGEASDSFKRAGFKWGIGRELYTSPFIWIMGNVEKNETTGKYQPSIKIQEIKVKEIEYSNNKICKLILERKGIKVFEYDEEVKKENNLISTEHLALLNQKIIETETDLEKLLKTYEVSHTNELTEKQYENAMKILEKKVNKENEVF